MKNTLRKRVSLLVMTGVVVAAANAQQANGLAAEKIYIHYDKSYYVAGETIWFKAYLFNNRQPDASANNFYLQLFDTRNRLLMTKKYPVRGATVSGDIELADSLPQGYYTIRALTPAMLTTASPDRFYLKDIYVFNPSSRPSAENEPNKRAALSLQFFPESGHLVDGLLMTVGFKAVDSTGRPVSISGYIRTADSVTIAPFKTQHDGMGRVQFRPLAGKKYIAAVVVNGLTSFYPLPDVETAGINLKVEDEKGGKVFMLTRTTRRKEEFDSLIIIGETGDGVVYRNEVDMENYQTVKGHIITDSLPSGILKLSVFNADEILLAERVCFVDNREYFSAATTETIKKGTKPREENILLVSFPESIQHSCSVSVTALPGSGESESDDIVSSMLMTGEVRGFINNPGWYFSDTAATVKQALDNLMMIQGWSSIKLKNEKPEDLSDEAPEDRYLINVSGSLKDSKTKMPVQGGRLSVFFQTEDSINHSYEVEVNEAGQFELDSLLFRGETKFYYGYASVKGKAVPVDIAIEAVSTDIIVEELPFTGTADSFRPPLPGISGTLLAKQYMGGTSKLNQTKTLDPVLVKSDSPKRPLDEVNEKYTTGVFTALGKMNFDNINEPENDRSLSVYDFIKRSINHVFVQDGKFVNRKNFSLFRPMSGDEFAKKEKSIDSSRGYTGGDPGTHDELAITSPNFREQGKNFEVALFLNESFVFPELLKTITMNEVALIKFYDPGFVGAGGTDGPGGAIAIYTKKDAVITRPQNVLEKLDYVSFSGYALEKKFYSPDYSNTAANGVDVDNRTTVYWNPEIITNDKTTTVRLRFFNSDISRRLKLVLEGFDKNGKLVHLEKIIE